MTAVLNNQRGAASIVALLLLVTVSVLAVSVLIFAAGELRDVRHYGAESRLRYVAEGNMEAFVKQVSGGTLPGGKILAAREELLFSDRREDGIRRRIYLKGDAGGMTVYSFVDATDRANGLKMFKQTKAYMELTDGGYAFKYFLP